MRQLIRTGNRDDRELFRLLTAAADDELRTLLTGTAATPFLKEGNEKMFGCIRSVAGSAVKVLEYIVEQQATPFSVRQWVRDGRAKQSGGPGGVLFIPYTAGEIAALRSVISAWMRLAIFQAMDTEDGDQRLWFVVDELDALGEIDGLKDALARLRKFGGRCILGFQSISQVSGTYGKGIAETIVENCGNTYILRCSASEHGGTSEFASKLIGQREVLHTTHSKTRQSQWSWKSSITSSQQIKIEPAVMASEIERLPDLTGFLKLASIPDWQAATLTRQTESTAPPAWRPSSTMIPLGPLPTELPTTAMSAAATSAVSAAATVTLAAASPASATASLSLPATLPSKPRGRKPRSTTTARTRQPNAAPQPTPQAAPVQNLTGGAQSPPLSP
jgi:type IV secretory pathway TraG/TraD family ATPase VirD4